MRRFQHRRPRSGHAPARCVPALVALLAVLTAGCATKRDIRDLRGELRGLRARQDSIFDLLQSQNRAILDSLQQTTTELLQARGEISHELTELGTSVTELTELTGQVQLRMNRFSEQLDAQIRQLSEAGGRLGTPGGPARPSEGRAPGEEDPASDFYEIGIEQLQRGNPGTARRAFRELLDRFPDDPRAPDAQAQVGETHYREGDYDLALEALEAVVERYPSSERAPMALYRAGIIAEERGNIQDARAYFQRVLDAYPRSDARQPAEEALRRLGG